MGNSRTLENGCSEPICFGEYHRRGPSRDLLSAVYLQDFFFYLIGVLFQDSHTILLEFNLVSITIIIKRKYAVGGSIFFGARIKIALSH